MSTYVLAEIGQNHNGSVEIAKELIDTAAMPIRDELFGADLRSVDAVKFTKRDLAEELTASEMRRPYTGPHSFGPTYGEHRAFLELSDDEHHELFEYARARGLEFVETLCSIGCLRMLSKFRPHRLKVASRDLTNLPLLAALAETGIPMIMSTGMSGERELNEALEVVSRCHSDVAILHCLSEYPSRYQNLNLRTIQYLKERYPDHTIGYSDHSIGIMVPVAAVALGAEIIEKHITLDRGMTGTDHSGSLEPEGLWRMVRDIRNVEASLGVPQVVSSQASEDSRRKLERSIATRRDLRPGDEITEADLCLLSPGDGLRWSDRGKLVGRRTRVEIKQRELVLPDMVE